MEETLIQLALTRQQKFNILLVRALDLIPCDIDGWVNLGSLGKKLRELNPEFENQFGGRKLSEWVNDLNSHFEINGQTVRRIDERITLLRKAYVQVQGNDGLAHIGQIGQALRKLDSRFESRFGNKKLSEWLEEYSYIFKRYNNYISLF